jgi:hypothetical protein
MHAGLRSVLLLLLLRMCPATTGASDPEMQAGWGIYRSIGCDREPQLFAALPPFPHHALPLYRPCCRCHRRSREPVGRTFSVLGHPGHGIRESGCVPYISRATI